MKNIRGGSFSEVAVGLVLLILILQLKGVEIEGFHIPIARPNGVISENSGPLAHAPHLNQKPGGRIRLRMSSSNQCPSHMTQISSFVKDGKLDLHQCHDEVLRRAAALGCENFECSFERFKRLATEVGKIDENSAREAISALNGEMLGYYSDTERVDYGKGIKGPDFKVVGQGKYAHVTHVEIKNPVGSEIEKQNTGTSDLLVQGGKIGRAISRQQNIWSNYTRIQQLPHVNLNTPFPKNPENLLGLVDAFDVPRSEKTIIENSVINSSTNSSTIVFINHKKNT